MCCFRTLTGGSKIQKPVLHLDHVGDSTMRLSARPRVISEELFGNRYRCIEPPRVISVHGSRMMEE